MVTLFPPVMTRLFRDNPAGLHIRSAEPATLQRQLQLYQTAGKSGGIIIDCQADVL